MRFPLKTITAFSLLCAVFIVLAVTGYFKPSAAGYCASAQELAGRNKFDAAQKRLNEAIGLYPGYAPAHLLLSGVLIQKRSFADALAAYHRALSIDPMLASSVEFRSYLVRAAEIEKREGFAATYARLAKELPAGSAGPAYVAACDLAARLQLNEFIDLSRQIPVDLVRLSIEAGSPIAQCIAARNYQQARKMIEQEYPGVESARNLAEKADRAGQCSADASSLFQLALKIDAPFVASLLGAASLQQSLGNADSAREMVMDAVQRAHDAPSSLPLFAADLLARDGRFDDAEPLVSRVRRDEPQNTTAKYLWAAILLHRDDIAQLRPIVDESFQRTPGDGRTLFLKGITALLDGQFTQAARHLSMASPGNASATLDYYRILADYRSGNVAQAEAASADYCARPPALTEALLAKAAISLTAGHPEPAEAACMAALEIQPDDPDALRLLAICQIAGRHARPAIETLEKYLKLRPESAREMQAVAAARMAAGDLDGVIAEHTKLLAASASPAVHHRILALACGLAGRPGEAGDHYRKLLETDPSAPDYWLFRARQLVLEGQPNAFSTAADQCREGMGKGAPAPVMLTALGVLNTMAGRFQQAREELDVAADVPADSSFIVDLYFALAPPRGQVAEAAEILSVDPFSRRSFDLLVIACSSGKPTGDLRETLGATAKAQPGFIGILNEVVVLRNRDAADACRIQMIDIESLWPRLVKLYKARGADWL